MEEVNASPTLEAPVKSPEERIAELEAKRAVRKATADAARQAQQLVDLEAYDALAEEHGEESLCRLSVERHVQGHPTFVVLRKPTGAQYKRFVDQVGKSVASNDAKARRVAQDLLAESCWCYPSDPKARTAMLEEFPGLHVSIAIRANALVEGKAEEEGKA